MIQKLLSQDVNFRGTFFPLRASTENFIDFEEKKKKILQSSSLKGHKTTFFED